MKYFFIVTLLISTFLKAELNYAPRVLNSFEEKKIVVCIPSYNNEKYYERNLKSVFLQKYRNFRVIYVDDASTDDTYELVKEYIENSWFKSKVTLIRNETNQGAMSNLYKMIHSCKDDEIIVTLDGDDWLPHAKVLTRVNQAYLDPRVWVTYGNFQYFPGKRNDYVKAVDFNDLKNGGHRKIPFMYTHLRTFYAELFKMIPEALFKDEDGTFLSMGWDVAIMLNLIDMVQDHIYFIPQVLYTYNIETPINDHKKDHKKQYRLEQLIKARPPLKKLANWEPK